MLILKESSTRLAGTVGIALLGCGAAVTWAQEAPREWSARDSAGVAIVTNSAPESIGAAFELSDRPKCRIGGNTGDQESDLASVPSASQLADGNLAVAEARVREIRIYRCDGTVLRRYGGPGGGPGEFQNLVGLWTWRDDSLLVSQGLVGSLAVFHPRDGFVRTIALRGNVLCCFADGSVLVSRATSDGPRNAREDAMEHAAAARQQRPFMVYERNVLGAAANVAGSFGPFPASETAGEVRASQPSRSGVAVSRRTIVPAPFGRITSVRPYGQDVVVGDGTLYEFRIYSVEGVLQRIVRATRAPTRVTSEDIEDYKLEQLRELRGASRISTAQRLDQLRYPTHFPAYRRLERDDEGRIWVEDYPRPRDSEVSWTVFTEAGTILGTVRIPKSARLLSVGRGHVLLRTSDADGFVTVSAYSLIAKR